MEQSYSLSHQRRTYDRFIIEGSATVVTENDLEIPSILKDVSTRGAGIVSNYPLTVNKEIGIFINPCPLVKSQTYRRARVAWSEKINDNLYGSGLDFGLFNQLKFT